MGQKVHPIGFRLGIHEDWRSRWYARKADFGKYLLEDKKIRDYIKSRYRYAMIPRIEIQRKASDLKVIVHTARPGIIIGKKGAEVDKLRDQLQRVVAPGTDLNLDVQEVAEADLEAQLVAENVGDQLSRRISYRRAIKRSADMVLQKGALGVKIMISGRLGGSEMSRREVTQHGSIPLQKIDAKIDYGFTEAVTSYGHIGVKCWIYKGDYKLPDSTKRR